MCYRYLILTVCLYQTFLFSYSLFKFFVRALLFCDLWSNRNKKKNKNKETWACRTYPTFINVVLAISRLIGELSSINFALIVSFQCTNLHRFFILDFNNSCSGQLNNDFANITKIILRHYSANQSVIIINAFNQLSLIMLCATNKMQHIIQNNYLLRTYVLDETSIETEYK